MTSPSSSKYQQTSGFCMQLVVSFFFISIKSPLVWNSQIDQNVRCSFDVHSKFDSQMMNTVVFVRCSKNDVRVRSMFDKMVFNPSLLKCSTSYRSARRRNQLIFLVAFFLTSALTLSWSENFSTQTLSQLINQRKWQLF